MKIRNSPTTEIVKKAYLRILPVQILSIVVSAVNVLFDNIMTTKLLGSGAMAAIGFFAPISTVIGISYVISLGIQVVCIKFLGSGKKEKVVSAFSTGFVFLCAFGLILSVGCLVFCDGLAVLLGAKGTTAELLSKYIRGYSFGIIGQMTSSMLMVFLPFNNRIKLTYIGIAVMIGSNVALNFVFILLFDLGIFGMGLSTSISYMITLIILLSGFLKKDRAFYLSFSSLWLGVLPKAIYLGLPVLMFTVGCTVKAYVLNLTLMNHGGDPAVAAMNVQGMLCTIIGAIPQGVAFAFFALGSLYYGEQDKSSYVGLIRYSLKIGLIMSAIAAVILMVGSNLIAGFFFPETDTARQETFRMLLLFPSYLVLNTVFNLFIRIYNCQEYMKTVNFLALAEGIIMAVFAMLAANWIGSDAVWLSFPIGEIICIAIIGFVAFFSNKKVSFDLESWIRLPESFGYAKDECLDLTVQSMSDVTSVSEQVIQFCDSKDLDNRKTMFAGLSVEEMAGNIVSYGFKDNEKHHVDIRVVAKDGIILRIRDDCREFDPKKYLEQFSPEDKTKNIGIRMIAGIAKDMTYRRNAGINTLLIMI